MLGTPTLTLNSATQLMVDLDLQGTLDKGEQYVAVNAKANAIRDSVGNYASSEQSSLKYERIDRPTSSFTILTASGQVEFGTSTE